MLNQPLAILWILLSSLFSFLFLFLFSPLFNFLISSSETPHFSLFNFLNSSFYLSSSFTLLFRFLSLFLSWSLPLFSTSLSFVLSLCVPFFYNPLTSYLKQIGLFVMISDTVKSWSSTWLLTPSSSSKKYKCLEWIWISYNPEERLKAKVKEIKY